MSTAKPASPNAEPSVDSTAHAATGLGTLYLVPAPLDFGMDAQTSLTDVMPVGTLAVTSRLQHWVCENAKTTRAYLKRVNVLQPLSHNIQALHIQELPHAVHKKGDHAGQLDARPLLSPALLGHDIGLISEAGMPAVADPGSSVVRAAHDMGLPVVPLVGPVSVLLALAASGLNGQNFAFIGYLPSEPVERVREIKALESLALKTGQSQLFIETPYRNTPLLQALLQTLQHNTRLAVCGGLTLAQAQVHSRSIKAWRQTTALPDPRLPAVYAIGR